MDKYEVIYRPYGVAVYNLRTQNRAGGYRTVQEAIEDVRKVDPDAEFCGDVKK
jgi:hypothetical protein